MRNNTTAFDPYRAPLSHQIIHAICRFVRIWISDRANSSQIIENEVASKMFVQQGSTYLDPFIVPSVEQPW